MTVFIGKATGKHNTALECIRTIAATYGCKILQLSEYDANETDAIRTVNYTPRIPVRAA